MADVTGTIGSEQVELKNAATEETLLKLLTSLKTLNQSILKTSSGSSGSAGAVNDVTDSLKKMSPITAVLSKSFSMVSGVLGGLIGVATAVSGAFIGLAMASIDNQAKMSTFYGALAGLAGQIPIFGGVLGGVIGLFQKMAEMQEANLEQYQKLTQVGINFGGSLTNLRMAASNSYLSLTEFSDLMKKNASTFAKMGGNVNDGAEAFARMSHELIASPVGDRLLALGYTAKDVNQGMADYIGMTGGRNAQEMKNTKAIISSSTAYMEQLDGLAQLTGKNREEMAEEMKKKAANAAFQAKLATMSEEERNKATIGMANAMAAGGEGAVDAFQAQVMGVAVQTKAGQAFTGMYSEGAEKIRQSADMVYDGNKSLADMDTNLLDTQDTLANEQKKYGEQTSYAIQMQGGVLGQTSQAVGANVNQINQSTREAREAAMKRKNIAESEAAEMVRANKSMQEFGQQIMGFLTPVIREMTPYMADVLGQFKSWMNTVNLPELGKKLGEGMKIVMEYLKNLFSEEGQEKIINDIKYLFGLIGIEIKRALLPSIMYSEADAEADRTRLKEEKSIYDERADAAKLVRESAGRAIAAEIDAGKTSISAVEQKRQQYFEEIENAKKSKNLSAAEKAEIERKQKYLNDSQYAMSLLDKDGKAKDKEALQLTEQQAMAKRKESEDKLVALKKQQEYENSALGRAVIASGGGQPVNPAYKGMTAIEIAQYQGAHPKEGYDTGTLGKTGKMFKDFGKGTQVTLHGAEAVSTPDQMADLVAKVVASTQSASSSDTNNLLGEIQQLNTLTAEMLRHIKDTAENTKRTVDATKSLSGNLF